ncbi:GAP family protein [[Mycobacterium] wendilense]|uniref:GAP family protein n=1 Tax=[Mycobacterium] wendilense TaxID=3064284 RepID=A0ABM9M902_9MYCO|nr:GAP family protein [Mycolicibacterium sp. MU0050]CAJ1579343.1 GAP family protein [Mycolicibacterium sp. MU0050]
MWGPLLVLALALTINPVRLGLILLVLSRPRPMQNLLAYWLGTLLAGMAFLLVPLVVFHATPTSKSVAEGLMNSGPSTLVQRLLVGLGVLVIVAAALMCLRRPSQAPQSDADEPVTERRRRDTSTSTRTLDPSTLPVLSRLVSAAADTEPESDSNSQRFARRAREAWRNGSPWISGVIGLMVVPADGVLLALALIVTSGAAIGMQLGAAVVFVIAVLTVEEVILLSHLAVPHKTQAALERLHDWTVIHHRKFMAAILVVVGVSLIVQGVGS